MRSFLGISTGIIIGGAALLASFVIPILIIYGSVSLADRILPVLAQIGGILLYVCLNVFVPLSLFRFTRKYAAMGFFVSSFIFGVDLWFLGVSVTYFFWGLTGLVFGLIMAFVGVVPLAMIASALHSQWWLVLQFVVGVTLTYGARSLGAFFIVLDNRNRLSSKHALTWLGKAYVGVLWFLIALGYVAMIYFEGWKSLDFRSDALSSITGAMVTSILMLPGVAILKLGERIDRKRQARLQPSAAL